MLMWPCVLFCVSVTLATVGFRPAGWLDRLVQYHKEKFLQDFNEVAPIKIKATVISRPPGYVDSPHWDYHSVMRLLALIRESEEAAPAKIVLRRALRPTRRFMSRAETFKHFPSLGKKGVDNMYYSIESDDDYIHEGLNTDDEDSKDKYFLDDDAVITISNPVEARLPSARISVALLKQIMEQRANAARIMPTTTRRTRSRKTATSGAPSNTTDNSTVTGSGNVTVSGNGTSLNNTNITTPSG